MVRSLRVKRARSEKGVPFAPPTAPPLRNTLLPDGSPAVKEDVERYLLGHAGKDVHAGYGEQWIKVLKAGIDIVVCVKFSKLDMVSERG